MQFHRASFFLIGLLGASYVACTSGDNPNVTPDGGALQTLDASVDATVGHDGGSSEDAGRDATPDAGVDEAGDAAVQGDAPGDAPADAADAAPRLDDAGCPVPTGVVADAADAGLPSTGIALWLRADEGVATVDGGVVCRWDDVSGNARSFVPGTGTPPVIDATGIKSKPGVKFTGNGTWLFRNDVLGLAATSARTIAYYARSDDTTHRHQFLMQAQPGSPGVYVGVDTNTYLTAGSREGVYVANNSFDSNVATSTTPHSHILSISSLVVGTAIPAGLVYAIDGTVTTLTKTAGSGQVEDFSAANTTWVGTATDPAFTTGELGEMLVYDHALTTSERNAVAQYFQARFP